MNCRFCKNSLKYVFVNLGETPLANSYLTKETMNEVEKKIPLQAFVCEKCFLVQVEEFEKAKNIFNDYAYFSSYSTSWLDHVKLFADEMIDRFNLSDKDQIIEIASNDGYLLKNFKNKHIPILGIEPASNVAKIAENNGIPTVVKFFSFETAQEIVDAGKKAHLLLAFNVLPHVPNLNDFVLGMKKIIHENGVIVIQFSAYLLDVIQKCEFDMVYHEHFSYFSLFTLKKIFESNNLEIFDVKEIPVHGGSLRLFLKSTQNNEIKIEDSVKNLLKKEENFGLRKISTYLQFQKNVEKSKKSIQEFFIKAKEAEKKIVCYGAAAKGNTVLNFCEITKNDIDYIVDISPHKQGKFLPGTHIPIYFPEKIKETRPDYIVILAWNLKDEIIEQTSFIKEWGGKFVVLIPKVKILK
ncbi:class I SAM-dependent methyltransferase [Nitrosopumilus ureiphilus]|nr:class I SAM-dependent methyltransferase [Nitrosopumilus ureiphilus]